MARIFLGFAIGLKINTTKSIPMGLYRVTEVSVAKDEYVIFCPPQMGLFDETKARGYIGVGFCLGGYPTGFFGFQRWIRPPTIPARATTITRNPQPVPLPVWTKSPARLTSSGMVTNVSG